MSEFPPDGPEDGDDLGPPAIELQQLVSDPSPGFFDRIRTSIDRRVLTGQLFEQAWTAPLTVFLEFVGAVFGLIGGADDPRREPPGTKEPKP
jgi:hypothetical protein